MNCKQPFVGSTGSLQPGTSIQNSGKQKAEMAEHPVYQNVLCRQTRKYQDTPEGHS